MISSNNLVPYQNVLYNKLVLYSPDEETEGLFLVDFTQKIIDKKRETLAQKSEREDEERGNRSPVPPPENPNEEW